ncbi:transposase [Streptomyces sp. NA02950]|uniref:transposase n=1 Tax=Streptomyces sp. NA02950 TaxID=2742137 RepID=UPI0020CABD45|nr:transposase [Streptomyces sp. NA02950]
MTKLLNATSAVRDTAWRGRGTACSSDSKKFGSWCSNFMTEYHARLLNFGLLPRMKNIGSMRLHRPGDALPAAGRHSAASPVRSGES